MGPATDEMASLMGPADRQGHGATRKVADPVFARIMTLTHRDVPVHLSIPMDRAVVGWLAQSGTAETSDYRAFA